MSGTLVVDLLIAAGLLSAVAVGSWAGVRRYRELGRIAREALAAPPAERAGILEVRFQKPPTVVRLAFRVIAFVLGPLIVLVGLASIGASIYLLFVDGFRIWWSGNAGFDLFLLGGLSMPVGFLIANAAITGRDPYLR